MSGWLTQAAEIRQNPMRGKIRTTENASIANSGIEVRPAEQHSRNQNTSVMHGPGGGYAALSHQRSAISFCNNAASIRLTSVVASANSAYGFGSTRRRSLGQQQ